MSPQTASQSGAKAPRGLKPALQFGFWEFCFGNGLKGLRGIGGGGGTGALETAYVATSENGKAVSAQNAITHGLLSKRHTILADETREDYEETRLGWLKKYTPADYHETRLVDQLILNDWLLQRANRRILAAEAALVGEEDTCHPATWTAEQEHKIELVMRYKTTQERAFYRSLNALEGLRKDLMREEQVAMRVVNQQKKEIETLEKELAERPAKPAEAPGASVKSEAALTEAQKLFQGQKSTKKRKKIPILEQWVEIEVSPAGKTVTTQYPSNEILIQDGQKKWPAPELVYRRMHFLHGVPHEYAWTTSDERIRKAGGMGIQRMTVDTWLELIKKEKALGTGHILPCGGNCRGRKSGAGAIVRCARGIGRFWRQRAAIGSGARTLADLVQGSENRVDLVGSKETVYALRAEVDVGRVVEAFGVEEALFGEMVDDHVQEFDLVGGRGFAGEKRLERGHSGGAVEAHKSAEEKAEAVAQFAGMGHVVGGTDARYDEHLLDFG